MKAIESTKVLAQIYYVRFAYGYISELGITGANTVILYALARIIITF